MTADTADANFCGAKVTHWDGAKEASAGDGRLQKGWEMLDLDELTGPSHAAVPGRAWSDLVSAAGASGPKVVPCTS